MQCKQCEVELTGRQRVFCSDKCRMAMNRGTKANEVGSGLPKANKPEQNTTRTEAEPEQNESEQRTRTRPPIPGDPDYVGVWQVKPDPVDMHALTDDDLIRRLHCIRDWKHSPEHQEILRRRNEVAA